MCLLFCLARGIARKNDPKLRELTGLWPEFPRVLSLAPTKRAEYSSPLQHAFEGLGTGLIGRRDD
jgi:hypothetical protein